MAILGLACRFRSDNLEVANFVALNNALQRDIKGVLHLQVLDGVRSFLLGVVAREQTHKVQGFSPDIRFRRYTRRDKDLTALRSLLFLRIGRAMF